MAFEQFTNGVAQTTLNGSINNSVISLVVNSASGFPTIPNFRIRIDSEIMTVTAISGTTWTVTRGVEGTTAATHTNSSNVDFELTAGGLIQFQKDSIQSGLWSGRPSSNCKDGMLYFANDAPYLSRYNGTLPGWEVWGPLWKLKPPKAADFTGVNLGTSIIDESHGFMNITCQAHTGLCVRGYFKTAPSTPYRVKSLISWQNSVGYQWVAGVAIRNNSSGKIAFWGPNSMSPNVSGNILGPDYIKMTDPNTFFSQFPFQRDYARTLTYLPYRRVWWGLYDNGTNRTLQWSFDNYNWIDYYNLDFTNEANNTYFTANQVGFVVGVNDATNTPVFNFHDWSVD